MTTFLQFPLLTPFASGNHKSGLFFYAQGVLDMAAKKVNFLIDTEATYSVLIFHTGSLSSKSCTVTGVNGKSYTHFTGHLTCQF